MAIVVQSGMSTFSCQCYYSIITIMMRKGSRLTQLPFLPLSIVWNEITTVYVDQGGKEMSPEEFQKFMHGRGVRRTHEMNKLEDHVSVSSFWLLFLYSSRIITATMVMSVLTELSFFISSVVTIYSSLSHSLTICFYNVIVLGPPIFQSR